MLETFIKIKSNLLTLWFGFDFCEKRKINIVWPVNRTFGCFDPRIKNSHYMNV